MEIQLRFRKGQDNWHTAMHDLPQRAKYKRGYLPNGAGATRIKDKLLPVFDYYLDTTSAGNPAIVPGTAYRDALSKAAAQPFRMVPYFDPGVWGGDWMKTHFDLPENGSNYAWSFDGVRRKTACCWISVPVLWKHRRSTLSMRTRVSFWVTVFMHASARNFPFVLICWTPCTGRTFSLQVHPDRIHSEPFPYALYTG